MKFESITLLTSELEETLQFYEETLECPVQVIDQQSFIVQIGETELRFEASNDERQPFYHFAIDIPYNHFYDMKLHYQNILFLLMSLHIIKMIVRYIYRKVIKWLPFIIRCFKT